MLSELISFWNKCDLDKPPFLHPDDRDLINRRRPSIVQQSPSNFDEFIERPEFSEKHLHFNLIPQPYGGDLKNARIVILLINPGLGFTDYWGEVRPEFRMRLANNLHQNFDQTPDFPFPWLDPSLCWHGGFVWWEKKLREVANAIAMKKFEGNYRLALSALSKTIASVELVPYHSFSFGAHSLINQLPSVSLMLRFVQEHLKPRSLNGSVKLIATRQVKSWGLEDDDKNIFCYGAGQSRTASLTSRSKGGMAILRAFGIAPSEAAPLDLDD